MTARTADEEQTGQPDAAARLTALMAPEAQRIKRAGGVTVLAALLWLPQAAGAAFVFAELLAGRTERALYGIALFLIAGVLRVVLNWRAEHALSAAADRLLEAERAALLARVDRISPYATAQGSSASLAALAADKLDAVRPYILRYRPAYLRGMVLPLAIIAVLACFSWIAAMILLVAGPLIPVFMALVGMAAEKASQDQMDEIGSLNDMLIDRIRALGDIRLLGARAQAEADFEGAADRLRTRTMGVLRIAFLSSTVLELFAAIGVAMVAVYVGFSLLGQITFGAYAAGLTAGQGIFILLLAPDFFQPLRDIASAWHDKAAASAVARDLVAVEAQEASTILGTGGAGAPLEGPVSLTARGLRFGSGAGAIHVPDFTLGAGERLALTGPSGSGKSTLLAALAGLTAPTQGEITVCGEPLEDATADGWRARLSWAPQEPHFFAQSLARNLTFAEAGTPRPVAQEALRLAAAEGIVDRLPRGLLTRLGESGAGISGGEARRLMIARLAHQGRDVILADEPTADLDSETAAHIRAGLLALAEAGATLIVATHDPDLVAAMGRELRLGDTVEADNA